MGVPEAARFLGVDERTLRQWIAGDRIPRCDAGQPGELPASRPPELAEKPGARDDGRRGAMPAAGVGGCAVESRQHPAIRRRGSLIFPGYGILLGASPRTPCL